MRRVWGMVVAGAFLGAGSVAMAQLNVRPTHPSEQAPAKPSMAKHPSEETPAKPSPAKHPSEEAPAKPSPAKHPSEEAPAKPSPR